MYKRTFNFQIKEGFNTIWCNRMILIIIILIMVMMNMVYNSKEILIEVKSKWKKGKEE